MASAQKAKVGKITSPAAIGLLFALCWLTYFSTYLGRLNYSASLSEMIRAGGFTKQQGGLIGTGFFLFYGAGQLVSGFLGDRLSPKWMVFGGLLVSAAANLGMGRLKEPGLMTAVWCVNGLAQAFIWSPMIRILYDYLKTTVRLRACLYLNTSVPIGTMAAYGLTALVVSRTDWRLVFYGASGLLAAVSLFWLGGMFRMERYAASVTGGTDQEIQPAISQKGSWRALLTGSGLLFLMAALMIQGALKDGVTTWIPTYLQETYPVGSGTAILSTMVIPISNLLGVYLASIVDRTIKKGEAGTSGIFFALCAIALMILLGFSGKSMKLALVMLALSTTAMMAVNTMLIAVLPSRFGVLGKASSVSGILNSAVYLGGAASTYGIGAISGAFGWNRTILLWILGAFMALILCLLARRKWDRYQQYELCDARIKRS